MTRWCLLLLVLTANYSFAQARTQPPEYARALGSGKAWVTVSRGPEENAILQVWISGSEAPVDYAEAVVHAYDSAGKEIPITDALSGERTYTNFGFGKYRGDTNTGFYKLDAKEQNVGKITIERQAEKAEFPGPKRPTYLTFKPIRGGQAAASLTQLPWGGVILDVLLKGITASVVRYDEIKLTALDSEGALVPLSPLFKEHGTYILGSKDKGVFTGKYRIGNDTAHVTKVVMRWAGEEIEFSGPELPTP